MIVDLALMVGVLIIVYPLVHTFFWLFIYEIWEGEPEESSVYYKPVWKWFRKDWRYNYFHRNDFVDKKHRKQEIERRKKAWNK